MPHGALGLFLLSPGLRKKTRRLSYLAGGEQQTVAVARALSGDVRVLLVDEPFEGLAPAS
jgi:ABC-type branched-subunit amino acid transport system ATPase component